MYINQLNLSHATHLLKTKKCSLSMLWRATSTVVNLDDDKVGGDGVGGGISSMRSQTTPTSQLFDFASKSLFWRMRSIDLAIGERTDSSTSKAAELLCLLADR